MPRDVPVLSPDGRMRRDARGTPVLRRVRFRDIFPIHLSTEGFGLGRVVAYLEGVGPQRAYWVKWGRGRVKWSTRRGHRIYQWPHGTEEL